MLSEFIGATQRTHRCASKRPHPIIASECPIWCAVVMPPLSHPQVYCRFTFNNDFDASVANQLSQFTDDTVSVMAQLWQVSARSVGESDTVGKGVGFKPDSGSKVQSFKGLMVSGSEALSDGHFGTEIQMCVGVHTRLSKWA